MRETQRASSESEAVCYVLLVEDEPDVLNDLREILRKKFPRIWVDTATSVWQATFRIRQAEAHGIRYHLALLDFKLPEKQGMQDEVDTTVCGLLRGLQVPILHFTAYRDDPVIKEHMKEFHGQET